MRTLDEYMTLPYHDRIVRSWTTEGDRSWFGSVDELRGLTTSGATAADVESSLQEAKRTWIEGAIEEGMDVPEPYEEDFSVPEYSGRLGLRIAKGLHRTLAERAEQEGVSLNAFVSSLLVGGVGWGSGGERKSVGIGELGLGQKAGFDARALVYGATLADEVRHAREDFGASYSAEVNPEDDDGSGR